MTVSHQMLAGLALLAAACLRWLKGGKLHYNVCSN